MKLSSLDFKRYNSFVSGIVTMLSIGTPYAFSLYSYSMAVNLNFDSKKLMTIPLLNVLGSTSGVVSFGYLQDILNPTIITIIYTATLTLGNVLMFLANSKLINYHFLAVSFYSSLVNGSCSGIYLNCLVTNSFNFKSSLRGRVVGSHLFSYSLSAMLISLVYKHIVQSNVSNLMITLTFWNFFSALYCICGLKKVQYEQQLPVKDDGSEKTEQLSKVNTKENSIKFNTLHGELDFMEILKNSSYWLIIVYFCGTVSNGYLYANIVGSIVASNAQAYDSSVYVITFSLGNAFSRLITGVIVDFTSVYFYNSLLLLPLSAMMLFGYLLILFFKSGLSILFCSLLTGISYGGLYSVVPVIMNKYFGNKGFGKAYGMSNCVQSIVATAAGLAAGAVSDSLILPGHEKCIGDTCYDYMISYCCITSVLSSILAVYIYGRERRLRQKV